MTFPQALIKSFAREKKQYQYYRDTALMVTGGGTRRGVPVTTVRCELNWPGLLQSIGAVVALVVRPK